jgi:hypothetical protein
MELHAGKTVIGIKPEAASVSTEVDLGGILLAGAKITLDLPPNLCPVLAEVAAKDPESLKALFVQIGRRLGEVAKTEFLILLTGFAEPRLGRMIQRMWDVHLAREIADIAGMGLDSQLSNEQGWLSAEVVAAALELLREKEAEKKGAERETGEADMPLGE